MYLQGTHAQRRRRPTRARNESRSCRDPAVALGCSLRFWPESGTSFVLGASSRGGCSEACSLRLSSNDGNPNRGMGKSRPEVSRNQGSRWWKWEIPRRRTEECLEKIPGTWADAGDEPSKLVKRRRGLGKVLGSMASIYLFLPRPDSDRVSCLAHTTHAVTHLAVRPGSFYCWGACRGGPESKSPPSLLFSRDEKTDCWKERCGRGNEWLRMEEKEREGEEEVDICSR
ncbi:hypothetical protein QBC47DRAFT_207467 [Echria macrotheca]|uniref:Uncharacterized protein n=1 Tax=Echria macrotheca TaxID=438768 RepID=A0AAJ0F5X7_9PEZI|nr:hypothetical protein QBC47DRAFT_207467 [Echria macrotheca]